MENNEKIDEEKSIIPNKEWFTLKEACGLKGINQKTVYNKRELMPNKGKYEGSIGGRYCFTRKTVLEWLTKSDEQIRSQKNR
jgi:hypothetical protein